MIRILAAVAALAFSLPSMAYDSVEAEFASRLGIVVPAVATDGFVTRAVARDSKGNLLVCPVFLPGVGVTTNPAGRKRCTDGAGRSAWRYPAKLPPAGRTYVGFRILDWNGANEATYQFYWK